MYTSQHGRDGEETIQPDSLEAICHTRWSTRPSAVIWNKLEQIVIWNVYAVLQVANVSRFELKSKFHVVQHGRNQRHLGQDLQSIAV